MSLLEKLQDIYTKSKLVYMAVRVLMALLVTSSAVGLPAFALFGWTVVDPGERGIYVRNGQIQGQVDEGFHPMIPLTDRVRTFDMRVQKYEVSNESRLRAITKEDINVYVEVAVRWNIRDDKLSYVYKNKARTQEALVQKVVQPAVQSAVSSQAGQYSAERIGSENRVAYEEDVREELNETLWRNGLKLNSVEIINVEYPEDAREKFRQEQKVETQKQIAEQKVEIAKKNAKRQRIQAEADAEAIEIRREALSEQYITYLRVQNINETDTVYVIPRNYNGTVETSS